MLTSSLGRFLSSLAYVFLMGLLEAVSSLGAREMANDVSRVNGAVHDVYMKDMVYFLILAPRMGTSFKQHTRLLMTVHGEAREGGCKRRRFIVRTSNFRVFLENEHIPFWGVIRSGAITLFKSENWVRVDQNHGILSYVLHRFFFFLSFLSYLSF